MTQVSADLELVIDSALAQVDALEARLAEVAAGVAIDVDTSAAEAQIDGLGASPVDLDVQAEVGAAEAAIDGIGGEPVEVAVEADTSQAVAEVEALGDAASTAAGGAGELAETSGAAQTATGGLGATLAQSGTSGLVAATGYGAAAAAGLEIIRSFGDAEEVAGRTNVLLDNTGGRAGITADEIARLATRTQDWGVSSDESAQQGANLLLAMQNVRNEAGAGNNVFTRTIGLAADYTAVVGGDVTAATQRFGRALNDPVKGMSLLRRTGIQFTEQQQAQVAALVEAGDVLGAQRVLLDALEGRYGGAAAALQDDLNPGLTQLRESADEVAEAIGGAASPAVQDLTDDLTTLFNGAADVGGFFDSLSDDLDGLGGDFVDLGGLARDAFENLNPVGASLNLQRGVRGIASDIADAFGGSADDDRLRELLNNPPTRTLGGEIPKENDEAAESAHRAADGFNDEAEAADNLAGKVDRLGDRIEGLRGPQASVAEGAISVRDAQRSAFAAFLQVNGQYVRGTEGGDRFLGTLQDLGTEIRSQTLRLLETANGADKARHAQAALIPDLRRMGRQAGLSEREVDGLIRTFARVPERQITRFDTPGSNQAETEARHVDRAVRDVPRSVNITFSTNAAFVAAEIDNLGASVNNVDNAGAVAAGHSLDFHGVESSARAPESAAAVGGPPVIIHQSIDARGATNPDAVGAAARGGAESAMRSHQMRVDVRLRQP